jgi:hypothetical protein
MNRSRKALYILPQKAYIISANNSIVYIVGKMNIAINPKGWVVLAASGSCWFEWAET